MRLVLALLTFAALSACARTTAEQSATVRTGADSYTVLATGTAEGRPVDYKIGPLDVLTVTVFREPDLSAKDLQVDAGGNLSFPLIGNVQASGKTANELATEMARRLDERYLRNPQVSVIITSSVSQRVVVEGSVTEPGVYEIAGNATLLEALARAKSPTRTANLSEVVIFRVIDGQRVGGRFNLADIRAGRAADPRIVGGDTVVVGFSALKGAFRDFLTAAPLFNVFAAF